MWVLFTQQNTEKTANLNSIINFYFVICFYYFDNICMVKTDISIGLKRVHILRTHFSASLAVHACRHYASSIACSFSAREESAYTYML